ncbi:MAG: hypothetical protein JWN16_225 [Alphaproteobacteria bacterium]|nr:hypothetical protein [Alphaproteobacteria bacterium]
MAAPPPRLERLVLALIPPLAREVVAGDLCETFENPRQYAAEALRTVPFVIASQMRRHLNMPALLLKLSLWWLFLGWAALWLLPVLMLADAYQPAARPDAHRAIRQTVALGVMAMIAVVNLSMNIGFMLQTGLRRPEWLALSLFGLVVPALLCGVRTVLILQNDRHLPLPDTVSGAELMDAYRRFAWRARLHNIAEGAALVAAAVLALLWLGRSGAAVLTGLYLMTAVYLLARGAPRPLPTAGDFRFLQTRYARALARQHRLRHFLWWLWCAPAMMAAAARMHEKPLVAAASAAALALVCFVLAAINREDGGRVQEDIGALERLTG